MAQAKRDPWLEFAEPVDAAPTAPAATQPPSNDGFEQIAEPAAVVDISQTELVPAEQGDDKPALTLSPEDEKEYIRILSQDPLDAAGSNARRFLASKGLQPGPADDPKYSDSIEHTIAFRRQHGTVNAATDYLKPQPLPDDGVGGALARGIADVPTMGFMDELYGVAQAVQNPSGHGLDYDIKANIDKYRGTVDRDEAEHPVARIAGQLFGGLGIPLSYEGVAFSAGRDAMQAARASGAAWETTLQAGRQAAARAARNAMIRDGAYIGGAHGVGSGEGVEGRVGEGLAEAGLGAAGGAVVGTVGQVVAPRLAAQAAAARAAPLTDAQQVGQAAERQGIDLLPADVGGNATRRATSMVTQSIAGGGPIIGRAQTMTDQAQGVRDTVAQDLGRILEPEAAGGEAIRGARGFIARTSAEGRRLYNAAVTAAAGTRVQPIDALAALDRHIQELGETPGGADGLNFLQGLRDALTQAGGVTIAGMRNMRTALRDQFISGGLRGSDLERRVGQVVDSATNDIVRELHAAGRPEAARAYQLADRYWRNRIRTIDQVIEPIIGKGDNPKSGEQVIKTLNADLQGNNRRAVAFLRTLGPGEAGDVRASIIGSLGRSSAGRQNAGGDAFSLNEFLTNWNKIGETAKRAYFGLEARAALNDLALVAQGTKEAQRYSNFSNTGGVVGNLLTLMSGVGGIATFGKTVGAQYALGRLLASPRFARWLARAPRTSLSQSAYIDRLGRIAKAEPAIAADVLSLQQRLTEAFSQAPMKAAASDTDEDTSQRR